MDEFAVKYGVRLSITDWAERHNRALADEDEPVLETQPQADPSAKDSHAEDDDGKAVNFNPNEPRDASGKWTTGAGVARKGPKIKIPHDDATDADEEDDAKEAVKDALRLLPYEEGKSEAKVEHAFYTVPMVDGKPDFSKAKANLQLLSAKGEGVEWKGEKVKDLPALGVDGQPKPEPSPSLPNTKGLDKDAMKEAFIRSFAGTDGKLDTFIKGVDEYVARFNGLKGIASFFSPGAAAKADEALYKAICSQADFSDATPLQGMMLKRYMDGDKAPKDPKDPKMQEKPYELSAGEVVGLMSEINFMKGKSAEPGGQSFVDDVRELREKVARAEPGTTVTKTATYNVPSVARLSGTLGNYTAVATVTVSVTAAANGLPQVSVDGNFKALDTYDFDYIPAEAQRALTDYMNHTHTQAGKSYQGRNAEGELKTVIMSRVPGTPFKVTSVPMPISQTQFGEVPGKKGVFYQATVKDPRVRTSPIP